MRRPLTALIAALAALAVMAPAALANSVSDVAAALRSDPVYVDPTTSGQTSLTSTQADALRRQIAAANAGPMFVAILPQAAADANGGVNGLLVRLQSAVGMRGTYALIAGKSFRAGSTDLRTGLAGELATESFQAHRSEGASGVLSDFVRRVAAARASGGQNASGSASSGGGGGGRSWLLPVLAILAIGIGGGVLYMRRKQKQFEKQAFEEVRDGVRGDLQELSNDILALDTPTQDKPDAREHYGRASADYSKAAQALDAAAQPADLRAISSAIEDARYEMACTHAVLDGKPVPERLPPCFFDPNHGPSVRDVQWMGPSGGTRDVPACQRCIDALQAGQQPATKTVVVQGQTVPYWSASGPWQAYHGGFFGGFGGGGFLQGLILGEILSGGGGFGGWGGGGGGGGGNGGDDGGGWGDFGGGGGGFGGGDFGGGGGGGDGGGGGNW
jgi:hypothetical protein